MSLEAGRPSRTALLVAALRAAHQTIDQPVVFVDPFARAILGPDGEPYAEISDDPRRTGASAEALRFFVAARSRFAEETIATAVGRGVRQIVVLGAGLDTFLLRNPFADRTIVFEVDHPATQAWKRHRLEAAALEPVGETRFVAVDFGKDRLSDRLADAGFQADRPAVFHWLGVSMYLPHEASRAVLGFVAGIPESAVAFDYVEPPENYPPERRPRIEKLAARAASLGEVFRGYWDPSALSAELAHMGFGTIEDLTASDLRRRYLGVAEAMAAPGAHVVAAWR